MDERRRPWTASFSLWSRPVFVWGVWAGMFIAAFLFVWRYGHNVPYYDEWSLVYVLSGERSVDLEWLWSPRNGHRIAVPKLLLVGLHALAGWDFRNGMFACVVLLGLASAALVWAVGRSRGATRYSDALFPLLLLNWGHYDNMLWGWQFTQVLPIAIAVVLLAMIVRWRLAPPFPVAVIASIGVIALPLSGVPGLACAPGFALWLLEAGRRRWLWATGVMRRQALVIWALAGVALLLVPAYFVGLHGTGAPPPDALRIAKAVLSFLAHGFGLAAQTLWPWPIPVVWGLFAAATFCVLTAFWAEEASRRSYALALLFVLIALAGIVVSVGVGRPTTTFPHRYFLFAVPLLCWVYLAADLARRERTARAGRAAMLALSLAATVYNTSAGLSLASARSSAMGAFEADVRAGSPPSELIAHHQRTLLPYPETGGAYWHEGLGFSFDALRRAEIGAFAALVREADFREVAAEGIAERSFVNDPEAPVSGWIWEFIEPRHIAGVRMVPARHLSQGWEEVGASTLQWARRSGEPFANDRRYVHWWTEGEPSATVWIYDTVATLRIPLPDDALGAGASEAHPELWSLEVLLAEHDPPPATPYRDDRPAP